MNQYTVTEFRKQYPTDDVCLDKLFQVKYGKLKGCPSCGVVGVEFKRIPTRRCYQCVDCGHQLYPTQGTIFEKTRTPLTYWFYSIYLYTVTRNGVAAKELERQLGVTYKTAFRMAHQIRILLTNPSNEKLFGEVMMDEVFIGGQDKFKHDHQVTGRDGYVNKQPVFGMMEKDGRVITKVVNSVQGKYLKPIIRKNVDTKSIIVTDGFGAYAGLNKEYKQHEIINHTGGEYVHNGFTTNHIENYWSTLKRMIKGTHIHVSKKHLPKYLAENTFRYEHRKDPANMFETILKRA